MVTTKPKQVHPRVLKQEVSLAPNYFTRQWQSPRIIKKEFLKTGVLITYESGPKGFLTYDQYIPDEDLE